jgi:hypothetical protein
MLCHAPKMAVTHHCRRHANPASAAGYTVFPSFFGSDFVMPVETVAHVLITTVDDSGIRFWRVTLAPVSLIRFER